MKFRENHNLSSNQTSQKLSQDINESKHFDTCEDKPTELDPSTANFVLGKSKDHQA